MKTQPINVENENFCKGFPKTFKNENYINLTLIESPTSDKLSSYKLSPKRSSFGDFGPWNSRYIKKLKEIPKREIKPKIMHNNRKSSKRGSTSMEIRRQGIPKQQFCLSGIGVQTPQINYQVSRANTSHLDSLMIPSRRSNDDKRISELNNSQIDIASITEPIMPDIEEQDQNDLIFDIPNVFEQAQAKKQRSFLSFGVDPLNSLSDQAKFPIEICKTRPISIRKNREILKLSGTESNISPKKAFAADIDLVKKTNLLSKPRLMSLVPNMKDITPKMKLSSINLSNIPLETIQENMVSNKSFQKVFCNAEKEAKLTILETEEDSKAQHKIDDISFPEETFKIFKRIHAENKNPKNDLRSWLDKMKKNLEFTPKHTLQDDIGLRRNSLPKSKANTIILNTECGSFQHKNDIVLRKGSSLCEGSIKQDQGVLPKPKSKDRESDMNLSDLTLQSKNTHPKKQQEITNTQDSCLNPNKSNVLDETAQISYTFNIENGNSCLNQNAMNHFGIFSKREFENELKKFSGCSQKQPIRRRSKRNFQNNNTNKGRLKCNNQIVDNTRAYVPYNNVWVHTSNSFERPSQFDKNNQKDIQDLSILRQICNNNNNNAKLNNSCLGSTNDHSSKNNHKIYTLNYDTRIDTDKTRCIKLHQYPMSTKGFIPSLHEHQIINPDSIIFWPRKLSQSKVRQCMIDLTRDFLPNILKKSIGLALFENSK